MEQVFENRKQKKTPLKEHRFAAIDIGSNAIRLLIKNVYVRDGKPQFKKRSLIRVPIRLGQSVFQKGVISTEQEELLIEACMAFRHLLNAHKVDKYMAFATSAMRQASNSEEIIKRIKRKAKIDIEVITGQREAKILYSGYVAETKEHDGTCLYVDVGGGSTELTLFRGSEAVVSRSFRLGTVRILQMQNLEQEWRELKRWLKDTCKQQKPDYLIGTGGNIGKLYRLSKDKKKEKNTITEDQLKLVMEQLQALTYEERIYDLNLNPDRADVIIPAGQIFTAILNWAGSKTIQVPRLGLADGMVLDLFKRAQ